MISYEDLLLCDAIPVKGAGHVRSPRLRELRLPVGIGWAMYATYLHYLKKTRKELVEAGYAESSDGDIFEIIISNESLRALYQSALAFFMSEKVLYYEENRCFVCVDENTSSAVGVITPENFDEVRLMILTLNYVSTQDMDIHTTFSSPAAEEAWKKVQQYLEEQQAKSSKSVGDEKMTFGNMLSKLCAIHPSLNYNNVFDLTVFQFYDAFFQTAYMRGIEFNEAIVSAHGSDKFEYDNWLNPVKNF